ncbi:MAG: PadR family transcriptional regulator [candidate division Zixibacteria bacterium]
MKWLSRKEELVLLSIKKLEDDAYGVTIREQLARITRKYWSIGAIYDVLDRLLEKGMVKAAVAPPLPGRSGRSRRIYTVSQEGIEALAEVRELNNTINAMLTGAKVRSHES